MKVICSKAGLYKPCVECRWAEPWEATMVRKGGWSELEPAPGFIASMGKATKKYPVAHSKPVQCPRAKELKTGCHVPVRVMEVLDERP